MNEHRIAVEHLERIQKLWVELERTRPNTPEYQTLIKEIRVLSTEYQALVDAHQNPGKQK